MMAHAQPWTVHILTLFPGMFPGPLGHGLAGTALEKGFWSLKTVDIRRFARDKHGTVDGPPYGGGPGMVLRPDVLASAIDSIIGTGEQGAEVARICLTPRGTPVSQAHVKRWVTGPGVILVCGRFEGIDQRVIEARGLEEVCVGDFVMSSGEPAAIALTDGCVRLLPGVMGNSEGVIEESFERGLLEYPQYTRPRSWQEYQVPHTLLSGDHEVVRRWRQQEAKRATEERRPDLWRRYQLSGCSSD